MQTFANIAKLFASASASASGKLERVELKHVKLVRMQQTMRLSVYTIKTDKYLGGIASNGDWLVRSPVKARQNPIDTLERHECWNELIACEQSPVEYLQQCGRDTVRCCICGIALTDPESKQRGMGPICAGKVGVL